MYWIVVYPLKAKFPFPRNGGEAAIKFAKLVDIYHPDNWGWYMD